MNKNYLAWLVFAGYLCLLVAPDSIQLGGGNPTPMQRLEATERMVYGICAWIVWFAVFGRLLWLGIAASIPLFLVWLPAELYLRLQLGAAVSASFIGLLVETNKREFLDFVSVYWPWMLMGGGIPLGYGVWAAHLAKRHQLTWMHRSRMWFLLILPTLGFMTYWTFDQQDQDMGQSLSDKKDIFWVRPLGYWATKWGSIYPLDPYLSIKRYVEDQVRVQALRQSVSGFKFGASPSQDAAANLIVLVIGESARADRWQLNGYKRETNPLLSQQKNLVYLSDVVTFSTATRTAVPAIVSRHPIVGAAGEPNKLVEPSFLKALSELGYQTYWLSNQSASGFFDTSVVFYARDAAFVQFSNPGGFGVEGAYDGNLLKGLHQAVSSGQPAAIVLHTLGSHFNYAHRYPDSFDYFKPSIKQKEFAYNPEVVRKVEVNNAYDNSIRYTDYVLSEVIKTVDATGRPAVVVYVADHGEDIYEPGCVNAGLVRSGEASFRVPAFVWYSKQFAQLRPELVQAVQTVAHKPLQTDFVFAAMMDFAGVTLPGKQGEAQQRDTAFIGRPSGKPRIVSAMAGGAVDFDEAVKRDRCRISPLN